MNRRVSSFRLGRISAAWLALLPALHAQLPEQSTEAHRIEGETVIEWFGHQGRTYFIQVSDDSDPLRKWLWAPVIEPGNDQPISYEFGGDAPSGFARLQYTDQTAADPDAADFDGDGLGNLYEIVILHSHPLQPDTDGDGLNDMEDWMAGGNPNLADTDGDGLDDAAEVAIGSMLDRADTDHDGLNDFDEVTVTLTDPTLADTDGDTMPDGWELQHDFDPLDQADGAADADSDDVPNSFERRLLLDPYDPDTDGDSVADGDEDTDKDSLTNVSEIVTHATKPEDWDSDDDGLPDGWEITHTLDPHDPTGDHGTDGDPDVDDLSNHIEWLCGTDPRDGDSDDDDANDGIEVGQGGNPIDNGDLGAGPPEHLLIDVPFTIGDPSESKSEQWKLVVKGLGPDDNSTQAVASPNFGQTFSRNLKLRKWNRYQVTVEHESTAQEYKDEHDGKSDYDWEAKAENKPETESREHTAETPGQNNFFMVGGHWLADNRQAVFTHIKHGNEENIVDGKIAYLVPVGIEDNLTATGVDDVSLKSDDLTVRGYQDKFWIMAPMGGPLFKNDMRFDIPVNPPVPLDIACENSNADPQTINIGDDEPTVTWLAAGPDSESTEKAPDFLVGEADEPVDMPIRVKSMKLRSVKVTVFPVRDLQNSEAVRVPDEALIETKLEETFGYQLNAWMDVTVMPEQTFDYDADGDGFAIIGAPSAVGGLASAPPFVDPGAHIRVFVIDHVHLRENQAAVAQDMSYEVY